MKQKYKENSFSFRHNKLSNVATFFRSPSTRNTKG